MSTEPLYIHTHDRIRFKRCRRKWLLASPLRLSMVPKETEVKSYLWFGSGFHFALEDYHGYNRFGHPIKAFDAYVESFPSEVVSPDCLEIADIAEGMFEHYVERWRPRKDTFKTLWLNGVPCVELEFSVEIPDLTKFAGRPVYYRGTLDRVVTDCDGRLWIMDYKTAAKFDIQKLETDPQINAYVWAGRKLFKLPLEGMIYLQFRKAVPQEPWTLASGGISTDKKQKTTYGMYYKALRDRYGPDSNKYPAKNLEFLRKLADQETPNGDPFIRYDLVRRTDTQVESEYHKIVAEGLDMLDSECRHYPNPTRDCFWQCVYRDVCMMMDDGSDWKWMLQQEFKEGGGDKEWRNRIKWPRREKLQDQLNVHV